MVDNFLTVARISADTQTDIIGLVRHGLQAIHSLGFPIFDLEKGLFYGLLELRDLISYLDKNRSLDIWI